MEADNVRNILPAPNNTPYVIATVIMASVCVLALVFINYTRPDKDNSTLNTMIIGFTTTTTWALLAFLKAQETHLSVNSRLDQFIKNADRAARSEGELVGRAAGLDQANRRTDDIKLAHNLKKE